MNEDQHRMPVGDRSGHMSLEEARSVLWLRSNHRPLGELLDKGYLTEARLAWAAQNAYDPKLKQAAAVLLEWVKQASQESPPPARAASSSPDGAPVQVLSAGTTLEQARATVWPFRPLRGQPLGDLIDARRLTLKDLVYAVENAWDERVRRAAVVMTAVRLNQIVAEPPPRVGPLKVTASGRSHSEGKQIQLTMLQGAVLGGAIGVMVTFLVQQLLRPRPAGGGAALARAFSSPRTAIASAILFLVLIGIGALISYLPNLAVKRLDREIESYRKGQEGEDSVVEALRQHLDGSWALFRNVTPPGRSKGDIDAVLVGPPGVWALEIKNLSGIYRNVGERWEFRLGKSWKTLKHSPSRQANNNAARLGRFFEADGIKQWVHPAVVWANYESALTVQNPAVAVWQIERLPEELGNLWQHKPIEEDLQTRIVEKLTALCQQRASERSR